MGLDSFVIFESKDGLKSGASKFQNIGAFRRVDADIVASVFGEFGIDGYDSLEIALSHDDVGEERVLGLCRFPPS